MFNNFLKKQKDTLENELTFLNSLIKEKQNKLNQILSQIKDNKDKLDKIQGELSFAQGIITMEDLGMEYKSSALNLTETENRITSAQNKIAKFIGLDKTIEITKVYKIDGSEAKGRKFQKTFCENLLMAFNGYFEKKRKGISSTNFNKTCELLSSQFEKINKRAELIGFSINKEYLDLCLELLQAEVDNKIAKAEEKEKIKEERRRLREQEKLLAEAEKAKIELQKQRRMYEQSLAKALNEQERQEFETKLKEIDKREADVDYRINNSKAGYLYITATKSMPNMTKLGVTRRLNPLVRIQELSSAATPYPFICYGLVFSDDAFELETRIHEYFDSKRVNQENKHKEFFYITPQEAIKVLKEEFGCDVHFVNEDESEDEEYK